MNKSFDVFCTTISQREVQGHSCNRGHKLDLKNLESQKAYYKSKFKSSWRSLEQTAEVDFVREKKLQNFNNNSQTDKVWHTG